MRRSSNSSTQEVNLFVGSCRLIVLNADKKIDYASRTIMLTEKTLFTYHVRNKGDQRNQSKGELRNSMIQLQKLVSHEFEYKLSIKMRPKLLLQSRDPDIVRYLKQLKVPQFKLKQSETLNIVAIAVDEQQTGKYINSLIFTNEKEAINFYEAFNYALGFQIYNFKNGGVLPFNFRLCNLVGDILNGNCVIDPLDFGDGKQQEDQIKSVLNTLNSFKDELIYNHREDLFTFRLAFKINDQKSLNYACQFLAPLSHNIQHLNLSSCHLVSNMLSQVMLHNEYSLFDKLPQLQILDLSNNYLNDDILTTLSNILRYSKMLHQLKLKNNKLTLEKEGHLNSFLQAIYHFKIILDLSNNQITSVAIIAKYFIGAQGHIPIQTLDIYNNPIQAQQLGLLTKAYLQMKQRNPSYTMQLKVGQIQFQDVSAFEFLTQEYRHKVPKAMSLPLSISRHSIQDRDSETGMTKQQTNRSNRIDSLLKQFEAETIAGNFYNRKKIKEQLLNLGIDEDIILNEPVEIKIYRLQQQNFMINKLQKCLNYEVKPSQAMTAMNESLKYVRRKGLTGDGVDCLAFIKNRAEQLLDGWSEKNQIGDIFRQIFVNSTNKYTSAFEQALNNKSSMIHRSFKELADLSSMELQTLLSTQEAIQQPELYIFGSYLLMNQKPARWSSILLELLQSDPRMSTIQVVRSQKENKVKFLQIERVSKIPNLHKKSLADIVSNYGIESYRFSQSFIESGVSSSGYPGVLSRCKYDSQYSQTIQAFIQIFNNFMQILYHTPEQLSEQAVLYTNTIANQLIDRQNQVQNDLNSILAQELFIRMITYYDYQKHKPLKRGLLLTICQFLMRRVSIQDELKYRVMAYLIKTGSFQQQELNLHFSQSQFPWQGKIDWKIKEIVTVRQILINNGKIKISIADISNQSLQTGLQMDELTTVSELWEQIKQKISTICVWGNINSEEINYYWLCGTKSSTQSWDFKYLPSYEHIGRLIFDHNFQKKFFIRRIIYPPQYHSLSFLRELKYQDLIGTFLQIRQSFRESASVMLLDDPQNLKVQLTIESIWIDVLIEEEVVLANLRRIQDDKSINKYKDERQKIINEYLSKIYLKYLPSGTVLNQENRNSVVAELRSKKKEPIPQIMSQYIRQKIMGIIEKVGIYGYTTKIGDLRNKFIFYVNNRHFIFVDKTSNPHQIVRTEFKDLLWFELKGGDQPSLNFDTIRVQKDSTSQRYQFSIQGEDTWICQCYSMLINICKMRLEYPSQLLFKNQDGIKGISNCMIKKWTEVIIDKSALEIQKYFSFQLPKSQKQEKQRRYSRASMTKNIPQLKPQIQAPINSNNERQTTASQPENKPKIEQSAYKPIQKESEKPEVTKRPKPPKPLKQTQKPKTDLPISTIPEQPFSSTLRKPSQNSLEIEQILQKQVGQKQNDEVIPARRSSGKSSSSRRRSRNR